VSYLAIARKYRPATFDEIVGQEHVTRTLKNALSQGRIHHAFLFSGARGVGKTTAARALARALNCLNGPTADPCGTCTSCVEVTAGNSPDLIEIDGASNNSVDDIRALRETIHYAATRGKWKVYLIDEVHMLSKGAFNALLKTLEEPPPHVVFIFATTESNRIPETILSRVQRFDFKRIPATGVAERLRQIAEREGVKISDAALRLIARAGEGSMRDAQSLLDQAISYGGIKGEGRSVSDAEVVEALGLVDRGLLYDMLAALVEGAPDRGLLVIEKVYSHGFELSEFTAEMLDMLRNATLLRLSPAARSVLDVAAEEMERLETITQGVDADTLGRTFAAMLDVHDDVARSSRPRIVLEMAVARLATTRPVQPVGALITRLEDLERRVRQGGGGTAPSGLRSGRAPRPAKSPGADGPAADDEGAPAGSRVGSVVASVSGGGANTRPRAPEVAPANPWEAFRAAVKSLGPALSAIGDGLATFEGTMVRVTLRNNRVFSEARREVGRPEFIALVHRHFGMDASLEIEPPAGGVLTADAEWKHRVMQDPAFRRVVDALGATGVKVIALSDE
jgi:DNA polymerase-3 subunit gamma/tau